jgi:hypothetical protein
MGALASALACGDGENQPAERPMRDAAAAVQPVLAQVGYWSGETDQGNPIGFRVSADGKVADLALILAVDSAAGVCTGPFSAPRDAAIEDEAFTVEATFPAGVTADVRGAFTDVDRAQGTFDYAGGAALSCGDMLSLGAISMSGRGTWQATWRGKSRPAIESPATCAHTEDGNCDEPEGTGLCAEGSDVVDCKVLEPTPCQANAGVCDDQPDACVNTKHSFACTCPPGYTGDGFGVAGCIDINECTSNLHGCVPTANCINTIGSYFCVCMTGLRGTGLGDAGCVDGNDCVPGEDCDAGATN